MSVDKDETSIIQIMLHRASSQETWGFRIQGGADYPLPLSVQKVTENGAACKCGLKAGDALLQINDRFAHELDHEQAKQEILASGNQVLLKVQRDSANIWKPQIISIKREGDIDSGKGGFDYKTSLAANKQEIINIGSGYNRTPKPFSTGGIYSESFSVAGNIICNRNEDSPLDRGTDLPSGMRSVKAVLGCPSSTKTQQAHNTVCQICEKTIIGVFAMVSGKPMHPGCFNCFECGKGLKNQGYYHIGGHIYCDSHAQR